MRILVCATRMGLGGAETHILTLTREFVRRGHSVCIISAGGILAGEAEKCGARHITAPLDRKDPVSVMRSCRIIGKTAKSEHSDIVHAHGRIPAFVCSLLSRRADFPVFMTTAHGLYDPSVSPKMLSRWGAHTIAVSDDVRDYIFSVYGLPKEKMSVIPNGVEIPDECVRVREPGKIRLLGVSRMDADTAESIFAVMKIIPDLVRRFPEYKITFRAVGDGSERGRILKKADEVNAACGYSAVSVPGGAADPTPFYREADIFIGSSRSLLEAMAVGVPSVLQYGAKCGGVLDADKLPEAEKTNFVCRGDMAGENLYASVSELIGMTDSECRSIGEACRLYVSEHHGAESIARRTEDVMRHTAAAERNGVLLCGYFGAGNAGDDAVRSEVISALKKISPDAVPAVITRAGANAYTDGVKNIYRFDLPAILRQMKKTRLFVLCGGSLLQDSTSRRSLLYYSAITRLAVRRGCRVMIWGGGAGPLSGKRARLMAAKTAALADAAGFRDAASLELLRSAGARLPGACVTADPGIMTEAAQSSPAHTCGGRIFAVSVRPLRRIFGKKREREIFDSLCTSVVKAAHTAGAEPLWIPLAPEDEEVCRELCRRCGVGTVTQRLTPEQAVSAESGCLFVIAMRLHAAVFASCAGVPAICLGYDPKVSAFAEAGGHFCVSLAEKERFELLFSDAVNEVLSRGAELSAYIKERTARLREDCKCDAEAAGRILNYR